MEVPTFIEFDQDLVARAMKSWYWYIGDPADPEVEAFENEVLAVTSFGDIVLWDGHCSRILGTRAFDYDYGERTREAIDESLNSFEFRQKYLYFNDAGFAEQIAEIYGPLQRNQCYGPRIFPAAGGNASDPENYGKFDVDEQICVSSMVWKLRERLPDHEWDFVDKVLGERERINEILRDVFPHLAATRQRP